MSKNGSIDLRDHEALEILADHFRKSSGKNGINGDELVALVGGLLKETGRPLVFTLATVENMIEYQRSSPNGAKALCVSLNGPEECSADPGDYFAASPGEIVRDECNAAMILAVRTANGLRDALNGAPIHP